MTYLGSFIIDIIYNISFQICNHCNKALKAQQEHDTLIFIKANIYSPVKGFNAFFLHV